MKFIRKLLKKPNQQYERKHARYNLIRDQLRQVHFIQRWLNDYICEDPDFNPYFFRTFFSKVCFLHFEDVPPEATATSLYYFDSQKQNDAIAIPWDEAETEYLRLRSSSRCMRDFEKFVNPEEVSNPYLQSIFWARQAADRLRSYLNTKEKVLQRDFDRLFAELFLS